MSYPIPNSDTAESVTAGHPDKLCDAISDSILDACLRIDANARVAVETMVKGTEGEAVIVLAGEVSLNGQPPNLRKLLVLLLHRSDIPTVRSGWMPHQETAVMYKLT